MSAHVSQKTLRHELGISDLERVAAVFSFRNCSGVNRAVRARVHHCARAVR